MTTRMLATAATCALVCLVLAAGCTSPVDLGPPTIEGLIIEVRSDNPLAPLEILVAESPPDPCPGVWFGVDSRTEIRITNATGVSGSTFLADSDELRVGVRVRAWADGDMLLTCPAVARAERVIVLE